MKIGFIGLGNMGRPMAENLIDAGHELTVYNRTRNKAEEFAKRGARVAGSPAEAAAGADVVITILSDDNAVEQVTFGANGFVDRMPGSAIHLSMSTISVELSKKLSDEHGKRKQRYVAAPVFGRPEAAKDRKLFIVVAGQQNTVKVCEPIFAALGQKTFVVGENAWTANVVKLSGNFLIASAIEGMAEATSLVRKYGVDPHVYLDVLTNSLFSAPVYKTYGARVASDNFEPVGFRMPLGLKDIRLTLTAAESAAVPMPFASV